MIACSGAKGVIGYGPVLSLKAVTLDVGLSEPLGELIPAPNCYLHTTFTLPYLSTLFPSLFGLSLSDMSYPILSLTFVSPTQTAYPSLVNSRSTPFS